MYPRFALALEPVPPKRLVTVQLLDAPTVHLRRGATPVLSVEEGESRIELRFADAESWQEFRQQVVQFRGRSQRRHAGGERDEAG